MTTGALRPALVALALAAFASGCGSDKAEPACPRGVIPADAAAITRFRDGPGRDLTDVVVNANILNILVDRCKYDKNSVAVTNFQIAVTADRGPADRSKAADFEYWVAVVDPERKILTRETFNLHFDFSELNHVGIVVADLEPRIPLPDVMKAPEYQIVVGFQLTPDELAWNRKQRANTGAQ
ncbi:MAG TPA: hypothetical protein VMH36_20905 [Alphaproteobacteria bacterium]|nr:hypothetical protein [Alphaproteobacteria bacterium]